MRRWLDSMALAALVAAVLPGCNRKDEAELPPGPAAHPAATAPAAGPSAAKLAAAKGIESPTLPAASHEPGFGLDAADPARDYVTRYLHATKRYAAQTACVVVKPSTFNGERSVVETHNDASGTCGKADELRDRFFVSVATDRMSLDESLHGQKLQTWPDGSDPDGPPGKVADIQDLRAWKTATLRDAFRKLQLAPLRVQVYGRGSYPVISIAGWHGPVLRTMSPAELEGPAKTLCEANEGDPLGIFAGIDRATILRITCPGSARFETL